MTINKWERLLPNEILKSILNQLGATSSQEISGCS